MKNVLSVCLIAAVLHSVDGAEIVAEKFDSDSTNVHLSGRKAGNVEWESTENVVIVNSGEEAGLGVTGKDGFVARVPLPVEASAIIVQAEVRATSATGNDTWVAVGLGNSSISPGRVNTNWGRGMFLLVTSNGRFQCLYNPSKDNPGAAVQVLGSDIPGFVDGAMIPIRVEYRKDENSMSMWVNEKPVLTNYSLEENGFTPDPSYAGVSGFGQKSEQISVDNITILAD
jgi:hypothetical protein